MTTDYAVNKSDAFEWLGDGGRASFLRRRANHQRIGQAWMNSLRLEDQAKLRGSLADPFFADNWDAVLRALAYLLEN
jgi:hypothetical protein